MTVSDATLNRAVLDIDKQLTGLAECRKQLLAPNTVETLDLVLSGIEHCSGILRASASNLRFSAGFAQDRRNTSTEVEPDSVMMRAVLRSRGLA